MNTQCSFDVLFSVSSGKPTAAFRGFQKHAVWVRLIVHRLLDVSG